MRQYKYFRKANDCTQIWIGVSDSDFFNIHFFLENKFQHTVYNSKFDNSVRQKNRN